MFSIKFDSLLISSKTRANTAVNDCPNQMALLQLRYYGDKLCNIPTCLQ